MRTTRLIKVITLLLAVFVVASTVRSFIPSYASPTEAAQQYWARTGKGAGYQVENFQVLEIRRDCGCAIVLASFLADQGEEPVHRISYVRVDLGPFGWYVRGGQSVGESTQPDLVLYATDDNPDDYEQVIYGQVFSPGVSAVEVSFDDGETRIDSGEYGCFVMVAPDYLHFVELRLIGQGGEVLARYDQPYSTNQQW